jgi:hypothetical protein
MNFLGFIMPLPILFIILYPVNGNRSGLLITSFLLGLTMDVFLTQVEYTAACVTLAYFRPYILFAFGISYEYQTIKLNDVLTPERFSFINFSNNSSLYVIYIRSVSSQFLLDILIRTLLSTVFTIISCIIIIYLIKPNKR